MGAADEFDHVTTGQVRSFTSPCDKVGFFMLFAAWIRNLFSRLNAQPTRRAARSLRQRDRSSYSALIQELEPRQLLSGQTITVTVSTDDSLPVTPDHTTLRDAVNQANTDGGGDTIVFAAGLAGSTITLTQGQLNLNSSMTITGLGANQLNVSGGASSNIFDVIGGATVSITGLTMSNGLGTQGGAISNLGNLTLSNDVISGNSASVGGGIWNKGILNSSNDTITGNTVFGGATGIGGGIYNGNSGVVTSSHDVISNNEVDGGVAAGGGLYNDYGGRMSLTNDVITGNTLVGGLDTEGGGLYNASVVTSTNNTYSLNVASSASVNNAGGGILNITPGNMISMNDTVSNNQSVGVPGSSATQVTAQGGGIDNSGTLVMTNGTVFGNVATAGTGSSAIGGGINNHSGVLTTTNDTITQNSVTAVGGGTATGAGLQISSLWNSANTIIAGNTGGDFGNTAGLINAQNTLIGDNSPGLANGVNGNIVNPVNQNIFVPGGLANNGGPTLTVALTAGSPGISTAAPLGKVTADNGTTLAVNNISFIAAGDLLQIGTEIVLVTKVMPGVGKTGTLTVQRALDGTIQSNQVNQPISLATDQTGAIRMTNNMGSVSTVPLSPPAVTLNPTNQSAVAGHGVTFTAAAVGNSIPSVAWQISTDGGVTFSNIPGATSTTLNFVTKQTQNGNQFRALFFNSQGVIATSAATLTVTVPAPPQVTLNPTNVGIPSNQIATFTAAATGNPPPTVQWQVSTNGGLTYVNLPGQTSTTLSVPTTPQLNGNLYRAVFTNVHGTATTTAATLTIQQPAAPVVTVNPTNQTAVAGKPVTFVASAVGTPNPTVKWQISINGGITFSDIPGATSATLNFIAKSNENGNLLRAVFVNSQGQAVTSAASLTIVAAQTAPVITTNPTNQSSIVGFGVTFTAAATVNPSATVRWQISTDGGVTFSNIPGATSTTLNFTTNAGQNGNEFRAVFTNAVGSTTTSVATLTVVTVVAPVVTQNPTDQTAADGTPVTFVAAASGTPVISVVWQISTDGGVTFNNIPGATSATLNFTAKASQNGDLLRAVFTNVQGSAISTAAMLTVT